MEKVLKKQACTCESQDKRAGTSRNWAFTRCRGFLRWWMWGLSQPSDFPSEVQSEVEDLCVRGKRRVAMTMLALMSWFEIVIIDENGRQWPECKNACFCLSLWSMFCVWLWIIGDSIRASDTSGQSSLCLFIQYISNAVNPWIIIVSTFSQFLCNLMDLSAADVLVKMKKQECLWYTCWINIPNTLKHTPLMLSHSSAKSPCDRIQYQVHWFKISL